ncbi:hypothetical protein DMX09_14920 [Pseudomonas protegens]|uniref:hypothetical protein n=1 Tax=Pseudomonas protegens TaxID=380021 RepID=UPI000D8A16A6|nr:hypothetical protein [Pseudomonas protegens]PYC04714.1 hypothetical protein DMX09_14920 [Pseudomonas protegens]
MNAAAQFKKEDILAQVPDIDARYTLEGGKAIGEVSGFGSVRRSPLNSASNLSDEVRLCREVGGETARVFDFYKGENGSKAYTIEHLEAPWSTLFNAKGEAVYSDLIGFAEAIDAVVSMRLLWSTRKAS